MQYTIESRELTTGSKRHHRYDPALRHATVEARDPDEAINRFVRKSDSELMTFLSLGKDAESIATVRKDDSVFLVRVYPG